MRRYFAVPGFNPNPSCICVDGTFYLVTSSFLYFPALPVYVSKDLVNWTQIGNVCTRQSQIDLTDCKLRPGTPWAGGLWAPTIRYNKGTFYVTVTLVYSDKPFNDFSRWRNLLFTTTDPVHGQWSEPLEFDFPGYDTSLFFENGRAFVQGAFWWRVTPEIQQFEIDLKTGENLSGSPKRIWSGEGGLAPEGPHIYQKDGYYYLILAEGKTLLTHCSVMARSHTIWGPWERCPSNPIISSAPSAYLQAAGHSDIFQAPNGQWFAVCLAIRGGHDYWPLGRETCLVPLDWPEGGWPKPRAPIDIRMLAQLPPLTAPLSASVQTKTDVLALFRESAPAFPPSIMTLRNPSSPNPYRLTPAGHLLITSSTAALPLADESARMLLRRQMALRSTWNFTLHFPGEGPAYDVGPVFEGGVVVYLDHEHQYDFAVTRTLIWAGEVRVRTVGPDSEITSRYTVDFPAKVKIESFEDRYEFWAMHKGEWLLIGTGESKLVSGGFTGVVIGPYLMSHEPVNMVVQDWRVEEIHGEI